MCKAFIHQFLQELPKCEHHLHIEGSLSPTLFFQLAKSNKINLPDASKDESFASVAALEARYERFADLEDFLRYYYLAMSVLLTEKDFESLAYDYFVRAHKDGVQHAEIFFDPQAHTERGIAYNTVVAGLKTAQARAEKDFGLTSKLIICFLRHLSGAEAGSTYKEAAALGHFSDGTLAGIGLDAARLVTHQKLFREVYTLAKGAGIHRTAHAGEEGPPAYIEQALDICNVERIDHGIRLVEDETLLKRVASSKTLVTVCPLSNLPIRKFLSEGVRFSINSDDPAYFGGYILDNYCAVQNAFDLSLDDWKYIADGAIEGSWCDEDRKKVLLNKVQECVAKFR
ncbi:hypothetical protein B0O99DRAFT_611099 [Bisporella sp. PMI_857]|nr:hypothetical protein B0O99DRAFT_612106 [Bisporella sp. PMI_857]KAH8600597.1 hypothetical protein B0O99DRAFT_611099 [Bisporella sp. PMI_857]